jgi:hypothetical protein
MMRALYDEKNIKMGALLLLLIGVNNERLLLSSVTNERFSGLPQTPLYDESTIQREDHKDGCIYYYYSALLTKGFQASAEHHYMTRALYNERIMKMGALLLFSIIYFHY